MGLQPASARSMRIALAFACVIGLSLLALLDLVALPANPLHTRLDCERSGGQCVFAQVFRSDTRRWTFRVGELRGAAVEYAHAMHGGGRFSVYLDAGAQRYFYASFALRRGADRVAADVDAFIANPSQQRLAIEQDDADADEFARISLALAALCIVGVFVYAWRKIQR